MSTTTTTPSKLIQTTTLADRFGYQSATIRRHLCTKGHFFGLTPVKMPNNRNLWPDVFPADICTESRGKIK